MKFGLSVKFDLLNQRFRISLTVYIKFIFSPNIFDNNYTQFWTNWIIYYELGCDKDENTKIHANIYSN